METGNWGLSKRKERLEHNMIDDQGGVPGSFFQVNFCNLRKVKIKVSFGEWETNKAKTMLTKVKCNYKRSNISI